MSKGSLKELFNQYITGNASPSEQEAFLHMVLLPEHRDELDALMHAFMLDTGSSSPLPESSFQSILSAIVNEIKPVPVRRMHNIRKWSWVAASLLVLVLAGTYLWTGTAINKPSSIVAIAPGKEGAVLTLANGTQVVLDSLGNGVVANQNGTQVTLTNGLLRYNAGGSPGGEIFYNKISTPKGRQFHVQLPDGTDVWLNAASTIRYPTAFTGKERLVEVTGEAYFEVAENAERPFIVNANNRAKIEVLGTHFNVNAYGNEESLNTTLLEGTVRISANGSNALLKPGEQAVLKDQLNIVSNADTDKILAWKNGLFNFEGMRLRQVMRQLERWYDIEVVYENNVPDIEFYGKLKRDISLADLFVAFKDLDIHFSMEGRKLTVLP